jgi:hypothetical protein
MLDAKIHPPVLLLTLWIAFSFPTRAAELKQPTAEAFQRYVQLTEARMRSELGNPQSFLYFDTLPEEQRNSILARLHSGQIVIEQMGTLDNGKEVQVPDGLIHHWLATGFIPGATRDQVLALAQDYPSHAQFYTPDVQRAHLLAREDQHFSVYYRFYRRAIVTTVYNTEFSVDYQLPDGFRAYSLNGIESALCQEAGAKTISWQLEWMRHAGLRGQGCNAIVAQGYGTGGHRAASSRRMFLPKLARCPWCRGSFLTL